MADIFLTKPGYEKLIKDLAFLKKRQEELHRDLAEARENGGAERSVEYQAAKETLGEVMGRSADIEQKLKSAKFFEEHPIDKDRVSLGCTVTIRDESGQEMTFTLVSADESEPAESRVSIYAPLAQGLIDKRAGEQVRIDLSAGSRLFKILKIE